MTPDARHPSPDTRPLTPDSRCEPTGYCRCATVGHTQVVLNRGLLWGMMCTRCNLPVKGRPTPEEQENWRRGQQAYRDKVTPHVCLLA